MTQEQDREFFRNYSIIIGILAVMIVVFFILARVFGINENAHASQRAEQVAAATKPVGEAVVTGTEQAAAPAPAAESAPAALPATAEAAPDDIGKKTYSGLCFSCHGTGLPGIPQLGDKAAWAPRISTGKELLHEHAVKGFTGTSGIMMPPKGGNPALSDDEVKAAVDYMVANSQ